MARTAYPSDLSDDEWYVLEPLVPSAKLGGCPRSVDMRDILNGIFYILRGGCAWRMMPHDLPNWKTTYDYFRTWRLEGVWERLNGVLREQLRRAVGRRSEPSAGVLDSQSVKTTEVGGSRATTAAKRSRAEDAICSSTPKGSCSKLRFRRATSATVRAASCCYSLLQACLCA